jgi:hypothetical protein
MSKIDDYSVNDLKEFCKKLKKQGVKSMTSGGTKGELIEKLTKYASGEIASEAKEEKQGASEDTIKELKTKISEYFKANKLKGVREFTKSHLNDVAEADDVDAAISKILEGDKGKDKGEKEDVEKDGEDEVVAREVVEGDEKAKSKKSEKKEKKEPKEKKAKREKATTNKSTLKKDPNAPKKPLTAYILYSNANRERIKQENPDIKFTDVAKALAAEWNDLSEAAKKKYTDLNAQDKIRYENEMKVYDPKKGGEKVCESKYVNLKKFLVKNVVPENLHKYPNVINDYTNFAAECFENEKTDGAVETILKWISPQGFELDAEEYSEKMIESAKSDGIVMWLE